MTLFSYINIKGVVVSLVGALIAYRIYWEATTGAHRRALAKRHGCLPAKQNPSKCFGIDRFLANIKAYREHRLLESWSNVLSDNKTHTILTKVLGRPIYLTDDPENVKAMLATNFATWSLGEERIQQMSAYLGHGIFTSEGAAWKHSRDMLRPCFERSQVADVSIMEKHTSRLMRHVPKDGTTVDLQPLFHELTLDIATEFLFGRSTDALDYSREDKACKEFIEAFDYCENPVAKSSDSRFGVLGAMLLPDKKFKKCAKIIRGMFNGILPLDSCVGSLEYVLRCSWVVDV